MSDLLRRLGHRQIIVFDHPIYTGLRLQIHLVFQFDSDHAPMPMMTCHTMAGRRQAEQPGVRCGRRKRGRRDPAVAPGSLATPGVLGCTICCDCVRGSMIALRQAARLCAHPNQPAVCALNGL